MTRPASLFVPLLLGACRAEAPVGRYSHVGVLSADGASLYVVGGASSEGKLADAWRFDLDARRWTRLPDAPEPLFRAVASRGDDDVAWVFGGTGDDGAESERLYRWSLADGAWEEVERAEGAPWPGPRYKAAAASAPDGSVLVHGGRTDDGDAPVVYADLWAWRAETGAWESRGEPGGPVYRQGLCAMPDGGLWWSAGIDGEEVRGDGLAWLAPESDAFVSVSWTGDGPGPRASHTFLCPPAGPLLWGGTGTDTAMWSFDAEEGGWAAVDASPAPPARDAEVSALLPDGGVVIMGGDTADPTLDDFVADVWRFAGGSWEELTSDL